MYRNFRQIMALWPRATFAASVAAHLPDIRVPDLAKQWRARNSIPPEYWPAVVAAAADLEIVGVNYAALVNASVIRAREPGRTLDTTRRRVDELSRPSA